MILYKDRTPLQSFMGVQGCAKGVQGYALY